MRRMTLLPIALVLGIAAAFLRGFSITNAMDADTGLYARGSILAAAPILFAVVALALLWAFSMRRSPTRAETQPLSTVWLVIEIIAAVALAVGGGMEFLAALEAKSTARMIFGIFSVFVAVALFPVALETQKGKAKPSGLLGFWATIPVFWAAFAMVVHFWTHAGNPVVRTYLYGTLALAMGGLAILGVGGFFFRLGRHRSTLFYACGAIFFVLAEAGGYLFAENRLGEFLHSDSVIARPMLLIWLFLLMHSVALVIALAAGVYDFGVVPEADEAALAEPSSSANLSVDSAPVAPAPVPSDGDAASDAADET